MVSPAEHSSGFGLQTKPLSFRSTLKTDSTCCSAGLSLGCSVTLDLPSLRRRAEVLQGTGAVKWFGISETKNFLTFGREIVPPQNPFFSGVGECVAGGPGSCSHSDTCGRQAQRLPHAPGA